MKLTFLFLVVGLMQLSASVYSQSTKLSLDMRNAKVGEVLDEIEKQSEFRFAYSPGYIDLNREVTVNIHDKTIDESLQVIFAGTNVEFGVFDRHILLYPESLRSGNEPVVSHTTGTQQPTVSGTVTDESGLPLPGVTVLVKGTTQGTVTNSDGNYYLTNVPEDATLVFSFVGMRTQEIVVGNQTNINVTMVVDAIGIEEVVAIGYGTVKKRDITGSISSVSTKDLLIQSASNVQTLLQGRLSGVSVLSSGVPGESPTIRIRGIGTLGSNSPLFVIDGFPTKSEIASQINPSDVESVQVLKDASSASIYGARAANGVILITTKRGKAGKVGLDIKINSGLQLPSNLPEMLNTKQYGEVLWNAMKNAGLNPSHAQYGHGVEPVIPDFILPSGAFESDVDLSTYNTGQNQYMRANKVGTNWAKEVYRPAPTANFDISAYGGNEKSKYFISTNYFSQNGIVKWVGYDRLSLRGNSQFSVSKNFTLGQNLSVRYSNYKGSTTDEQSVRMAPIIPVYDVMGNWAGTKADGLGDSTNPVADLFNNRNNHNEVLNLLGNVYLEFKLLDYFNFKTNIGANYQAGKMKAFQPKTFWNKGDKNTLVNSLNVGRNNNIEWIWNNTLTFSKTFADNNSIKVLLGSEALNSRIENLTASRDNFIVEDPSFWFLDAGEDNIFNSENGQDYSLFSLFARINYQYKDKIYLSSIIRRDGSSRFGKNNKFGYFPGVSGAWRISEESFLSGQKIFSDLKLRVSYGSTGNQEIGNYAFSSTYGTSVPDSSYPIKGDPNDLTQGIRKETIGNESIKWETTTQSNFGVDAGLLDNRLTFVLDYYRKYTSGILQKVIYPALAGMASPPYENIGELQNNGFELNINYQSKSTTRDLTYDLGLVLSSYRNEVKKLASNQFIATTYTRTEVGYPVSSFYGFVIDGIFQNQEEVDNHAQQAEKAIGRWIFKDVNEDGIINDNDRTYIGNPHPDFEYSFNGRLNYKKFDLNLFLQGSYGNDILFASKGGQAGLDVWSDYFNKSTRILDTWSVNNRDAKLPEINILNPNNENNKVSTYLVEDGSYLRIKLLELGYTLPTALLSKIGASQCRVYINAANLLTFTKYNNIDPEVKYDNDLEIGVDYIQNLPLTQVFSMGLSLSF